MFGEAPRLWYNNGPALAHLPNWPLRVGRWLSPGCRLHFSHWGRLPSTLCCGEKCDGSRVQIGREYISGLDDGVSIMNARSKISMVP